VGLQVNWNFFDGGVAKARAAQQEENIIIAETQFADTKNMLRFQVEQAYNSLQANFKNIDTATQTVDQAEESLRLARLRFQAGIGTQLDVSTAEADLTQAQGNLLSAILDYNRALASLQRATSYTNVERQQPEP
jgi:OMF family outer membrane factor